MSTKAEKRGDRWQHLSEVDGGPIAWLYPDLPLSPGTTYEVTLTNGIKSTDGLSLLNYQTWSFTTVSWPQVAVGDPAAGATGVPVSQTISVIFDKDMDWSTVTSGSFYLEDSDGWLVDATLRKAADKRTASLDPAADLEPGETYVVTLTTAIKAENGLALQSPVTWSFTTAGGGPTFPDVPPRHPYYTAIMDLASRGIIGGYEDGRFGPGDAVLRAQFAKMIVGTLGLPVVEADFPNVRGRLRSARHYAWHDCHHVQPVEPDFPLPGGKHGGESGRRSRARSTGFSSGRLRRLAG